MLMDFMKAKDLLKKYDIKVVDSIYVNSAEEAIRFSDGDAIVLKLISEKAIHKSKAGLVKLNLKHEDEIKSAYEELKKRGTRLSPYKILAQRMVNEGIEIIVGGKEDNEFGKVIMIGMGGIYVETYKDVSMRLVPINSADAIDMINEIKAKDIITFNGEAEPILVNLLMKFSKLLNEHKEIKEMDINPIKINKDSYNAIDLRFII